MIRGRKALETSTQLQSCLDDHWSDPRAGTHDPLFLHLLPGVQVTLEKQGKASHEDAGPLCAACETGLCCQDGSLWLLCLRLLKADSSSRHILLQALRSKATILHSLSAL